MICIRPSAPALDLIGRFGPSKVRPPLSACRTARIQACGTAQRRDAWAMVGSQRPINCRKLIACPLSNGRGTGFPGALGDSGVGASRTSRAGLDSSFTARWVKARAFLAGLTAVGARAAGVGKARPGLPAQESPELNGPKHLPDVTRKNRAGRTHPCPETLAGLTLMRGHSIVTELEPPRSSRPRTA